MCRALARLSKNRHFSSRPNLVFLAQSRTITAFRGGGQVPTDEELNKGFEIGDWEILPARGVFRREDQEERPEPRVFGVLLALAKRDGDLVTRDELIDELWGGRATSDEPINRSLSQLRGHLGDQERPHQYIETLTRRGYRLKQKVRLKERSPSVAAEALADIRSSQARFWKIVAVIAAVALLAVIYVNGPLKPGAGDVHSIGVLPFSNSSGEDGDAYLVSGFREELVQTLHNIPEFSIKSGQIKYPDQEVTGIARILDVDAVLYGSVQRVGDTLKISYQLDDGRSGINISADSINGRVADIFNLQEELALAVRNDLLGVSPQQLVSLRQPANFAALDSYLRGRYALEHRGDQGKLEDAMELFGDTIELDPNFGPAYLQLATAYALLPDYRNAPLDASSELAISTVERGIAVDDSITDAAGAVFGYVYHKQKKWMSSEQAYIRATRAGVVDSNAFNWYSRMLASVGRLDDALELVLVALEIDPASAVINSRVAMAYMWLGDSARAAEYFERSNQLGASGTTHLLAYALLLVREGRIEEAENFTNVAVSMAGGATEWITPVIGAFRDPSLRQDALDAINLALAEHQLNPQIEVTVRVLLGDIDRAMSVARLLEQPGEAFEMDLLFVPELLPLRQHPEFLDLMENLGIRDYWDEMGCIWQAVAVHCPKAL